MRLVRVAGHSWIVGGLRALNTPAAEIVLQQHVQAVLLNPWCKPESKPYSAPITPKELRQSRRLSS